MSLSEELEFFLFLVERYAAEKNCSTGDVMREWDTHGITQEILDSYEIYHQERLENAYEDIDTLLLTGSHAW